MTRGRFDGARHGGTEVAVAPARGGVGVLHRRGIAALEDGDHLAAGDRLFLQKIGDDLVHIVNILLEDLHRVGVALLQNFLDGTEPSAIMPNSSLMPYMATMLRAMFVAS